MEYRILGPLEVKDGENALSIPGAKERAVLALLLLYAGQIVPADRLIDQLWGEEPPESARRSLRVRMAHLRGALGADRILTRQPGYLLHIAGDTLDLDRFQRLLEDSEGAEPAVAAERLREALALWRGLALADFRYEPWAAGPIARLEELRALALEKRIDADLALGRHREIVGELEALVAEHPLRERFRAQLMLALYRSGRQAEALGAYQTARKALVEELGIEPGPALQELERAILRQDPSLDHVQAHAPERAILVVARDQAHMDSLIALAQPLSRRPPRELILARVVGARDLSRASSVLHEQRDALLVQGHPARAAVFTSSSPEKDLIRLAAEQDVDLLLLDAGPALFDDEHLQGVVEGVPCDVAVLVRGSTTPVHGPVLVPFAGADHDWAAIEIGAWIAAQQDAPLRLAGPEEKDRDASRLLASASLAVQRGLGVAAEPLLVEPGENGLLRAADEAALVVLGLSNRWQRDGLGKARSALAAGARPPVVLVRQGLRPGGLAPPGSHTRFTWSIKPR